MVSAVTKKARPSDKIKALNSTLRGLRATDRTPKRGASPSHDVYKGSYRNRIQTPYFLGFARRQRLC
jgi:hypothetical protein